MWSWIKRLLTDTPQREDARREERMEMVKEAIEQEVVALEEAHQSMPPGRLKREIGEKLARERYVLRTLEQREHEDMLRALGVSASSGTR